MPVGTFRSEEGWVQVDYGTGKHSDHTIKV